MTSTVSIRMPTEKKARIREIARPSVNAWLNLVIDRALASGQAVDWDSHYRWLHQHGRAVKGHPDDQMRRKER